MEKRNYLNTYMNYYFIRKMQKHMVILRIITEQEEDAILADSFLWFHLDCIILLLLATKSSHDGNLICICTKRFCFLLILSSYSKARNWTNRQLKTKGFQYFHFQNESLGKHVIGRVFDFYHILW